jgi:hypothetical protein
MGEKQFSRRCHDRMQCKEHTVKDGGSSSMLEIQTRAGVELEKEGSVRNKDLKRVGLYRWNWEPRCREKDKALDDKRVTRPNRD